MTNKDIEKDNINHTQVVELLEEMKKGINQRLDGIDNKINPMYEMWTTSTTLAKVTISLTKFIIKASALITAMVTVYLLIKKLVTGHY